MNPSTISVLFLAGLVIGLLLFYRPTRRHQCPYCGEAVSIDRIARPLWVKMLMFFLPTKSFKCFACMKPFLMIKK
ncbi:hypothetical protein ACFSUS_16340 [Spirosoma soli]|uniref:Zinc-ribbon domain-containing protein n=1 Tax=Spirosoma soli TaxID=1770529 RepID=A0ABW5M5J5_9BACT